MFYFLNLIMLTLAEEGKPGNNRVNFISPVATLVTHVFPYEINSVLVSKLGMETQQ